MPTYYVHLQDQIGVCTDIEGISFRDVAEARLHMMQTAGQIIADEMADGRPNVFMMLSLDDDKGNRIMTEVFSATFG